jgi:hypothetical protein
VEEAFIVESPEREGDFFRERIALATLSYGRHYGCYSQSPEFQGTGENAEKTAGIAAENGLEKG